MSRKSALISLTVSGFNMSSDANLSTFARVPQEVLEHIAFFAATDSFLGPPSGIVPLLVLNRSMYAALSPQANPYLYARIFASKFDLASATRRMGSDALPATALAEELRRRLALIVAWQASARGHRGLEPRFTDPCPVISRYG